MFPLLGIILFVAGTGCRTLPVMAPIDLEAGRWEVAEVPAVWRPRRGAPELTGELLVVRSAAGDRMVQFSKQGLPVVTAQVRSNRWQISSSLRGGVFRGRLPARRAVLWLLIDGCPPSPPPDRRSGWQLSLGAASGRWALTNHQTGEWIEGAVEP
jgi:hypothetical protein